MLLQYRQEIPKCSSEIQHSVKSPLTFHDGGPYHIETISTDLLSKSMDWFLHCRDLHHKRVNVTLKYFTCFTSICCVASSSTVGRNVPSSFSSIISFIWLLPFLSFICVDTDIRRN